MVNFFVPATALEEGYDPAAFKTAILCKDGNLAKTPPPDRTDPVALTLLCLGNSKGLEI